MLSLLKLFELLFLYFGASWLGQACCPFDRFSLREAELYPPHSLMVFVVFDYPRYWGLWSNLSIREMGLMVFMVFMVLLLKENLAWWFSQLSFVDYSYSTLEDLPCHMQFRERIRNKQYSNSQSFGAERDCISNNVNPTIIHIKQKLYRYDHILFFIGIELCPFSMDLLKFPASLCMPTVA